MTERPLRHRQDFEMRMRCPFIKKKINYRSPMPGFFLEAKSTLVGGVFSKLRGACGLVRERNTEQ